MTTKDHFVKWLAYGLALLPVWFAQEFLLSRFPLLGVRPMLLPLAAMAVAVLEGGTPGAGFGLAVGVLFDACVAGEFPGVMTLLLALLGLGAGMLAQYALRQDLLGCVICSALALLAIDAVRIAARLLTRAAPLEAMAALAGKEIAWSMCFVPVIYLLFRWVFRRVPKPTVF